MFLFQSGGSEVGHLYCADLPSMQHGIGAITSTQLSLARYFPSFKIWEHSLTLILRLIVIAFLVSSEDAASLLHMKHVWLLMLVQLRLVWHSTGGPGSILAILVDGNKGSRYTFTTIMHKLINEWLMIGMALIDD